MSEPQKIGKYEIQDVLGRGGMSIVYKGFDPVIARGVAIKAIAKARLADVGFAFPGQTEFVAHACGGAAEDAVKLPLRL